MPKRIPTGRIFQKTYKDRGGVKQKTTTWYLKYYRGGKPVELSSGTEDYDEALKMLRKKMADVGAAHTDDPDRVTMGQLFDLLLEDYRFKNRKSTYDTELRVDAHLRPFFGEMKVKAIGTTVLKQFVARRRRQEAEAATINKELAWVRRAMKIGAQHEPVLVDRVPHFDMLAIDNVREGTIDHEVYRAVRDRLPQYARIALVIGYHTGARKGEICSIKLDHVDMKAARIFRPGRSTKNGTPRYLPIYGYMAAELEMALAVIDAWNKQNPRRRCPYLLQRFGKRVFDFEKVWSAAVKDAGAEEALFHDLRRTAVTNMIDAGLSEKEAMEISGHKTRAVFDRYHIVSERRMKQNAEKLDQHLKTKEAAFQQQNVGASGEDAGVRRKERLM